MRRVALTTIIVAALLAGCREQAQAPPPMSLTAEAMGRYCGMNVLEHAGPKGQIWLRSLIDPVWFSSARDTLAFTMLPEEPKDISAIYVSDMAKAASWDRPGPDNWIDARKAVFVIGSDARGGMGVAETVPFSDRAAAEEFARAHGGRVVAYADVPRSAVLTGAGEAPGAAADRNQQPSGTAGGSHDGPH